MFCLQQVQFMTCMHTKKLINNYTIHGGKIVWFLPIYLNHWYKINDLILKLYFCSNVAIPIYAI